jgi:hypothetical protein
MESSAKHHQVRPKGLRCILSAIANPSHSMLGDRGTANGLQVDAASSPTAHRWRALWLRLGEK